MNHDLFVARTGRLDAAQTGVEILADSAKSVVVERVHADVAKATIRRPTVPAFPHGGRAVLHREEPRGIRFLQEDTAGDIIAPGGLQRGQQAWGADEAGREVPVEAFDFVDEFRRYLFASVGGQQVHGKSQTSIK